MPEVDKSICESISAMVDGEASTMELHRVLKAGESNSGVRETWARYQMVSAAMRGKSDGLTIDLSGAIRDAIDEEPEVVTKADARKPMWITNVSKMGIAASVAAVVVLSAQFAGDSMTSSPAQLADMERVSDQSTDAAVRNGAQSGPAPAVQPEGINARTVSNQVSVPVSSPRYPVVPGAGVSVSSTPSPEVQEYLQRVMELQAGNSALNSGRGMLPYARVPASETE